MLLSYLKSRYRRLIAFGVFLAVGCIVCALYQLPLDPMWYVALLTCVLAFLFCLYDFYAYKKRHAGLQIVLKNAATQIEGLPECRDQIERDYQDIILKLERELARQVSLADSKQDQMVMYYTLWAHQIKNPIFAMRLLIREERDSARRQELEQELFQIEQYVEMVLSYLRIESIHSDLLFKEYALDDMVRQAVKKYAMVFIHKKIALAFEESGATVLTDEKWLVFLIEQCLSNALKYTPHGGRIRIYMTHAQELVIEDTGIGIQKEDIPRLFEKGFTGYNGRMDKKSTGIGLYLCREVAQKLGHQLRIESEPGRGTRVFIGLEREKLIVE